MWHSFGGRYRSRQEMLEDLTADEYREHESAYIDSPWGPYVDNRNFAMAAMGSGCLGSDLEKIVFKWHDKQKEKQDAEDMKAFLDRENESNEIDLEKFFEEELNVE